MIRLMQVLLMLFRPNFRRVPAYAPVRSRFRPDFPRR
jgi:hypothetical protein